MTTATVTTPTVNLVAKSQLARLLAAENMTIEHSHTAHTASFDTNKRKLILPVWKKASEDVYDMLVAHEVGHALITPREDVYMPICERVSPSNPAKFFPYLNIVEDVRVDNHIKGMYAGVRRSYYNAFKELMESDFFGIGDGDIADLSFGDRVNIQMKVGQYGFVNVPFDAEEQAIVDEATTVTSFDDVVAVAEKIWNHSAKKKNEPEPKGEDVAINPGDGDGDGQDGQGDQNDEGQGEQGEGDAKGKSQDNPSDSNGKQSQPKDTKEKAPTGDTPTNGSAPQKAKTEDAAPDLKTDKNLEKGLAKLTGTSGYSDSFSYVNAPRLNLNNIIFDYKTVLQDLAKMREEQNFSGNKIYEKVRQRNKDFVANLVKQFEQKMAADECRRTRTAKTGQLDMRKIAGYKFSDDLFIKNQITADGKNHGMVFIMDWSGSMGDYLLPTIEQLLALCMFCQRMHIPFEVYAFTNAQPNIPDDPYDANALKNYDKAVRENLTSPDYIVGSETDYYGTPRPTIATDGFLALHSIGMIQFLSSKMSTKEFTTAAENLCQLGRNMSYGVGDLHSCSTPTYNQPRKYSLSSTPLVEATYVAIEIVNRFKAANRLDIVNTVVLTDGEPTSTTITHSAANVILNLPNRKQIVLRSPELYKKCPLYSTAVELRAMCEAFKEMTGTNIISVRISNPREGTGLASIHAYGVLKEHDRMVKEWKDLDFFSFKDFGYTESFVISSKTEVVDDDDIYDKVKEGATVATITRAFIKGNSNKATSRVLLARFSDLIAKKVMG